MRSLTVPTAGGTVEAVSRGLRTPPTPQPEVPVPRSAFGTLLLLAVSLLLVGCPGGGGGTPQITLAGDVACPVPPPVLDQLSATIGPGNTTVTVNARVRCNGIPMPGVVLQGEIRNAVRTLSYTFPATDAQGVTTLTANIPSQISIASGDRFDVRVNDASGNPINPPDPVGVTMQ